MRVCDINKAAARVDVNRASGLPPTNVAGLGQRFIAEDRRRRKPAIGNREHVEFVLALERNIDPRLGRVEVEMPRSEAVPAVWRYRHLVGQQPVSVLEDLERSRLFRLASGGV